ncbi:MAG: penicillin-binding protein 1A [Hyphomicrobiaceae bacterium TMED74]|nr:penicillin-binding protein [Filomicrobium sp.]RPG35809.1 MAG: penicillin-binding protein 1A [Hyphomicrobiaceae bacterium TMED74]
MTPNSILPPPQPQRRRRKRKKSMLLGLLGFFFAAGVVAVFAGGGIAGFFIYKASEGLPSYEKLEKYEPPVMTRIHAADGSLLAEYARERRIFVPINTVPKLVIGAFLSAEDKNFFHHNGLDYVGIGAAFYKHYVLGRRLVGASTITQQVAKNFLLTNERSFRRKLKEAILAIRIERAFSKEKILELYLNEIYLGIGSYGVAAAALNYFNLELKDLNAEQAAYLAALPKAPSNYHPFRKTKAATGRRNWILGKMAENGYITEEEAATAKAKPLTVDIRPFGTHNFDAKYFSEEVRRAMSSQYGEERLYGGGLSVRTTLDPELQAHARKALINGLVRFDRSKGWRGPVQQIDVSGDWGVTLAKIDIPNDIAPWRLGVVLDVKPKEIVVGLRPKKEQNGKVAESRDGVSIPMKELKWAGKFRATNKTKAKAPGKPSDVVAIGDVIYVSPKDPAKPAGVWQLMQIPQVGGGLAAMDPHTGRVLAIVGGFSFAINQFDRAIQAKRQPGSSFKPLVYSAALDNGYKPSSIVLDAPIEIEQGAGKDVWRPENYNKSRSYGPTTLRLGIEKSRNQMTVRLAQDIGMPLISEYAINRFGVYDKLLPVLSMSLGAGETTLLRMVTAYSMLANGGRKVHATLVDRIQNRWGKTVWRHDQRECTACNAESWNNQPEPEIPDDRKQVIDAHSAYQMTSMLEGVVQRGTATIVKRMVPGAALAGKTGTTNDSKDTWFVGYAPDLVVGVYVGYDTPRPMGKAATGGQVAAPIFANFMKDALAKKKAVPFRIPPGIKLVPVNRLTGLRAIPGEKEVVEEAFKPFEEPDDPDSFLGYQSADGVYGASQSIDTGRGKVY